MNPPHFGFDQAAIVPTEDGEFDAQLGDFMPFAGPDARDTRRDTSSFALTVTITTGHGNHPATNQPLIIPNPAGTASYSGPFALTLQVELGRQARRRRFGVARQVRQGPYVVGDSNVVVLWPEVSLNPSVPPPGPGDHLANVPIIMPGGPVLNGNARDLILPPFDITLCPKVTAIEIVRCLREAVGTDVRHIHILPWDWEDHQDNTISFTSLRTGRVYAFEVKCGTDLTPPHILRTEFQVRDSFHEIENMADFYVTQPAEQAPLVDGFAQMNLGVLSPLLYVQVPPAPEQQEVRDPYPADDVFDELDADIFQIYPMYLNREPGPRMLRYGEVFRMMANGQLLINDGVEHAIQTQCVFPDVARHELRAVMEICKHAFPQLQYISVLSEVVPPVRRHLRRPQRDEAGEEDVVDSVEVPSLTGVNGMVDEVVVNDRFPHV
ncbi:hypothetical protein VTJ04DRAFT_10859 [Mycothermus thermophilus]|uniref:uncharacterized protein n=1 Tax=Humicola insolens TaxID=85995 RepID=UPI003741FC08